MNGEQSFRWLELIDELNKNRSPGFRFEHRVYDSSNVRKDITVYYQDTKLGLISTSIYPTQFNFRLKLEDYRTGNWIRDKAGWTAETKGICPKILDACQEWLATYHLERKSASLNKYRGLRFKRLAMKEFNLSPKSFTVKDDNYTPELIIDNYKREPAIRIKMNDLDNETGWRIKFGAFYKRGYVALEGNEKLIRSCIRRSVRLVSDINKLYTEEN